MLDVLIELEVELLVLEVDSEVELLVELVLIELDVL